MFKCNLTKEQCSSFCACAGVDNCESCDIGIVAQLSSSTRSNTNVICPVHEQEVILPCSLENCAFFTQYPGVHNCALVYMIKHGLTSLSVVDISVLTKIAQRSIVGDLQAAMSIMRNSFVDSNVNVELEPSFITITNKPICIVCDKSVNLHNCQKHFIGNNEFVVYCSDLCYNHKPPSVVHLEKKSKAHIGDILQWAVRRYSTLSTLEQALGLRRSLLRKLLQRYLNIDISDLYCARRSKIGKKQVNNTISKRRGRIPLYILSFNRKIDSFVTKSSKKFGKIESNIGLIRAETCNILKKA